MIERQEIHKFRMTKSMFTCGWDNTEFLATLKCMGDEPSEKILHLDKVLQTHIIYALSKIFTILVNQQVRPLKPR